MTFVKGMTRHPNAGRKKGQASKTTIARADAIERAERESGRAMATQRLSELAQYFYSLGARYSPTRDRKKPINKEGQMDDTPADEGKSVGYMKEAARIYADLAPYQSPKVQSTTLPQHDPNDFKPIEVTVKFV